MKRVGFLYPKVCDRGTIRLAIMEASKGKRNRPDVLRVLGNIDHYIDEVHDLLSTERYTPSPYQMDTVREGVFQKQRTIFKPRFYPDQVVHWCVYIAIRPIIFSSMYGLSCGSIPGRGIHYGKQFVERWVRTDRKNTKYYLKMDIRHYYPSVDKAILMDKLRRKFKDRQLLDLIQKILDNGDGLPIGILLSQVFANFYLSPLDFAIKQKYGERYYIRYMDDMVVFGPNKKHLHALRRIIDKELHSLGLTMKRNWQVFKFDTEPLDYMGFRFYRDRTTLRRSIMLRITRTVRRVDAKGRNATNRDACAVISYLGWIKHSDSHGLYVKWIQPYLHIQRLKSIIRRNQRDRNQNAKHGGAVGVGPVQLSDGGIPQPKRGAYAGA